MCVPHPLHIMAFVGKDVSKNWNSTVSNSVCIYFQKDPLSFIITKY